MRILFTSLKGVGRFLNTSSSSTVQKLGSKVISVGERSEAKANKIQSVLTRIKEIQKTAASNAKALGLGSQEFVKGCLHNTSGIWSSGVSSKITAQTKLATVPLKVRNSKETVNAVLEKVEYENGSFGYVLKHNGKQLGYMELAPMNGFVNIEYLTNFLGRDKYRNIENVLTQGMIEDFARNGKVPNFECNPMNLGSNMGKRYSNRSLYEKMGMESGGTAISGEKALEVAKHRAQKFGEIIKGSLFSQTA